MTGLATKEQSRITQKAEVEHGVHERASTIVLVNKAVLFNF